MVAKCFKDYNQRSINGYRKGYSLIASESERRKKEAFVRKASLVFISASRGITRKNAECIRIGSQNRDRPK